MAPSATWGGPAKASHGASSCKVSSQLHLVQGKGRFQQQSAPRWSNHSGGQRYSKGNAPALIMQGPACVFRLLVQARVAEKAAMARAAAPSTAMVRRGPMKRPGKAASGRSRSTGLGSEMRMSWAPHPPLRWRIILWWYAMLSNVPHGRIGKAPRAQNAPRIGLCPS